MQAKLFHIGIGVFGVTGNITDRMNAVFVGQIVKNGITEMNGEGTQGVDRTVLLAGLDQVNAAMSLDLLSEPGVIFG